jgi:hypothetical protein
MKKKTFSVEAFKCSINDRLATSFISERELAQLCLTLENVLHETGNYGGFRYLNKSEVPAGCQPGIRSTKSYDHPEAQFTYTNEYRRKYS